MALALLVDGAILLLAGERPAAEFFGAYFMEWALSLDNLFMFHVIFTAFATPREGRASVLRWGIIGMVVLRGAIILCGTEAIARFRPVLWLFAAFLCWAAFKMFFLDETDAKEESYEKRRNELRSNWLVRLCARYLKFDDRYSGNRFVTTVDGTRKGTLLLLTLFVIEGTDIPFAFDSLPAAMSVSQSFPIVLSSNVLAVLGLRAIYFVIENMQERFSHMKSGIAILLAIASVKIVAPDIGRIVNDTVGLVYPRISEVVPIGLGYEPSLQLSVGVIVGVILATIGFTLIRTRPARSAHPPASPEG
jgi:tellurite resistance protein TerC